MANTTTQASETEYKQTSRIIFDGEDHKDAYAILDGMDEKISTEDRASAYYGAFYGKTGFRSFFNSIYVNTHDYYDQTKIAWRKLYDNIIKKGKVYFVTDYAYAWSYDSTWDEMRYSRTCFVSSDPAHFEPISFDRHFRTHEYEYDEGDNYSSLIQWRDCSFDFYAFVGRYSSTCTIRGKNFDIIILQYYGMYNFDPVCDAAEILYPKKEGRGLIYYFPFLVTTDGIQYYNMMTLFKKKKYNGICDIYRCYRYWVVDNGIFIYIAYSKYVSGYEERGDDAFIYVPVDYKNHKTGKLKLIGTAKYKEFFFRNEKYSASVEQTSIIDDCLVNWGSQYYDEEGTQIRHIRRIWKTMDKNGNISTHYGLWDKDSWFSYTSTNIPADGKLYMADVTRTKVYTLDLKGNYTKICDIDGNTIFPESIDHYMQLYTITDNGDGSYNIYTTIMADRYSYNTTKLVRIVKTRDFKTFTSQTIVNPVIIIPIPGRNKQLRIFLNGEIMESEKGSSSYYNYYNVKFWTDYAEKFSGEDYVRYIPKVTTNIRSEGQTCFFYKDGKQTGFSGFTGFLSIGEGDKVWYYLVFIGDLTLFTTSPKNFVVQAAVKEKYKRPWDPEQSNDTVRYLDQTVLNRVYGLPYNYYEEGESS